jgi:aspartate racemase
MKIAGIVGGIAPESTIEYYRLIVQEYRARKPDGGYPRVIINSIDLTKMIGMISAGDLPGVTEYLTSEVERLERAGADFGVLASNTPHVVFNEVRRRTRIPLISIVDAARDQAKRLGLSRLGLFGTRFTMQGRFYPDVFEQAGITLVAPKSDEQEYIHEKYFSELVNAVFLPETRERLLSIAERMRTQDDIQGVILAGTELPLILREVDRRGIAFLDTTRIHVEKIVQALLD